MGEHRIVRLRTCSRCGAPEVATAAAMARHLCPKGTRGGQARQWRKQGRCPRCGKKSAPYVLCGDHRFAKRLHYVLRRGTRYGFFVSPERGMYAMGDKDAKVGERGWYNADPGGRAPRGFFTYAQALLREQGAPMTEGAIISGFTAFRLERAKAGHLETSEASEEATA